MSALRRLFGMGEPSDNLRIIITRHGERTDLALGKQWLHKMQESGVRDPRVPRLSPRAHFREWNYDPPLTVDGEAQSASVGQKLLHLGYPIDYCYSSPAYRAVQTANKILESQGRKAVPVNVEPGNSIEGSNRLFWSFFTRFVWMSRLVQGQATLLYPCRRTGHGSEIQYQSILWTCLFRCWSDWRWTNLLPTISPSNQWNYSKTQGPRRNSSPVWPWRLYRSSDAWPSWSTASPWTSRTVDSRSVESRVLQFRHRWTWRAHA